MRVAAVLIPYSQLTESTEFEALLSEMKPSRDILFLVAEFLPICGMRGVMTQNRKQKLFDGILFRLSAKLNNS